MLSYCLKCKKNTESKNRRVPRTSIGKLTLLSNCTVYNKKKLKIYQRRRGQGIAKPIRNQKSFEQDTIIASLLGDILFLVYSNEQRQ